MRFPTDLLQDEVCRNNLQRLLEGLGKATKHTVDSWWEQALQIIQEQGTMWRRLRPHTGHQSIQCILRLSSPGKVVPAGSDYLRERNISPDTSQQAYALLATMAQNEAPDDAKHRVFHQLRQELQTKQQEASGQAERRRKIHI